MRKGEREREGGRKTKEILIPENISNFITTNRNKWSKFFLSQSPNLIIYSGVPSLGNAHLQRHRSY